MSLEAQRARIGALTQSLARMGSQRAQLELRLNELKAQLAEGDAPVERLQAERQTVLDQRVVVEKDLSAARSALDGVENELRKYEQTRQQRDQQSLAQREAIGDVHDVLADSRVALPYVARAQDHRRANRRDVREVTPGHRSACLVDGLLQRLHDFFDDASANEVSGTNYTAGGTQISGVTLTLDGDDPEWVHGDITWLQSAGAGFANGRSFIWYYRTGVGSTSRLIMRMLEAADFDAMLCGEDLPIAAPLSNIREPIFYIGAAGGVPVL